MAISPPGAATLPTDHVPPLVGRRRILLGLAGAAFGLAAVEGCTTGSSSADAHGYTGTASLSSPRRTPASRSSGPSKPAPATAGSSNASTTDSTSLATARKVAAAEVALIAAYDAAAVAHPGIVALIAPLRAHHVQHLQALDPAAPVASRARVSPSPSTASPAASVPANSSSVASSGSGAETAGQMIATLAKLERAAAAARLDDTAAATGSLARLIASIGGCEASHVVALGAT